MTLRPYSQQIVKLAGAIAPPDPATFCPANGYVDETLVIPNPFLPSSGWVLLTEFVTNSPSSTTFDPSLETASGQYAYDLGDGSILIGYKLVSHTYLYNGNFIVKIYGRLICTITTIDFNSDNIVGSLNLSDNAFKTLTNISLQTNSLLTGITFANSITGAIATLYVYSTGITGILDLSKFTKFTASASIYLHLNKSMTGITFASSITGAIAALYVYSTGISGILDLSKFTAFTTSANILLNSNPSMQGITFANSITGAIATLYIFETSITGVLDLSKFTTFTASAIILLNSNPSMQGITFANSITGAIATLYVYSTGITGILDLSKFTAFTTSATILLNSNQSLSGITFSQINISGFVKTLRIDNCNSLNFVDLSKLNTGISNLSWQMQNNAWSAAIVNQMLVQINTMSVAGFAGRIINIGGTNADPDSASGGFDGIAARNSLISKGFSVIIT